MNKYFSLKKEDGKLINYFQDGDGHLSKVPVVYEAKGTAQRKAKIFDAKVIEVVPTHAIVDENDKPFVYFISEQNYNEVISKLTILDNHKVITF